MPAQLTYGLRGGDLFLEGGSSVRSIHFLRKPTESHRFERGRGAHWRLISHLSLNYLGMTDLSEDEGAATLRELMGLYLHQGDQSLQGQISGIKSMGIEPITRRLPQHNQLVYGRGVGVRVTVDESSFAGVSPWPLLSVLETFFTRHVGINSFVELGVESRQRGKVAQWRARPGQRPHV